MECEKAFNTLKRALIEAHVLAPPDLTLLFILDTDASNVGMGGVLAQVGTGHFGITKSLSRLHQCFYWGQHRGMWRTFGATVTTVQRERALQAALMLSSNSSQLGLPWRGWEYLGRSPPQTVETAGCSRPWTISQNALPDQEAETIDDTLTAGMFSRFGAAESTHSDQGRNFESRVFDTMCERLGMHKTRTTPLHP